MTLLGEVVVAVLLALGAVFALVAAVGVLRFPDVLLRMHASTKAGTLGAGLVYLAAAVRFGDGTSITFAALTILFLMGTMPIGAHAIGRAAHRTGAPLWLGPGSRKTAGHDDAARELHEKER